MSVAQPSATQKGPTPSARLLGAPLRWALCRHYLIFSNCPYSARQILSPLSRWANGHSRRLRHLLRVTGLVNEDIRI